MPCLEAVPVQQIGRHLRGCERGCEHGVGALAREAVRVVDVVGRGEPIKREQQVVLAVAIRGEDLCAGRKMPMNTTTSRGGFGEGSRGPARRVRSPAW